MLLDLEHKYPNIECCEYVIMPNHFHAIIKIDRDAFRAGEPRPYVVTLGHIVGYFKSQSTKMIIYTVKNYGNVIIMNISYRMKRRIIIYPIIY